jgi:hypothetical protein
MPRKSLQITSQPSDYRQLAFGQIDNDGSKSIDILELLGFYGHLDQVVCRRCSIVE